MSSNYSEYFVMQSTDFAYWGSDATDKQAEEFNNRLAEMLEREFPGVTVEPGLENRVYGPDDNVCEEIGNWICNHYPEACTQGGKS